MVGRCDGCGGPYAGDDHGEGRGKFVGQSFCGVCWQRWLAMPVCPNRPTLLGALRATDAKRCATDIRASPYPLPSLAADRRGPRHFDFIEIGTSDWGTITQSCAGEHWQVSPLAAEIQNPDLEDLRLARGLAVEAVREHLENLPGLPRVTRVEAAMDERGGEGVLFCVSGANTHRHMGSLFADLPDCPGYTVDVMWYAKSLSSLGRPHVDLEHMLERVGRADLLERRAVRVMSWGDLCARCDVGTVDVVQIDCEGKDCAIIRGMLAHCDKDPAGLPRLLRFEANHLTSQAETVATCQALRARGYELRWCGMNDVVAQRW